MYTWTMPWALQRGFGNSLSRLQGQGLLGVLNSQARGQIWGGGQLEKRRPGSEHSEDCTAGRWSARGGETQDGESLGQLCSGGPVPGWLWHVTSFPGTPFKPPLPLTLINTLKID